MDVSFLPRVCTTSPPAKHCTRSRLFFNCGLSSRGCDKTRYSGAARSYNSGAADHGETLLSIATTGGSYKRVRKESYLPALPRCPGEFLPLESCLCTRVIVTVILITVAALKQWNRNRANIKRKRKKRNVKRKCYSRFLP